MSDTPLTITEAAEQLGIHEKRLRRLLQRSEYKDRTGTAERETRTGTRRVTVISSPLMIDLRSRLEMEKNWDNGDVDRDTDRDRERQTWTGTTGTGSALVVTAYERIIEEKDRRIEELQSALDHERQQSRELMEALKREQALRALPPIEQTQQERPYTETSVTQRQNGGSNIAQRRWWHFWDRKEN